MPQRMAIEMMLSGLGTEIIYSFIIIVCSIMIYYSTKEIYNLTKHNGIKYFRKAFLFFAVAYFFRSFIKFVLFYFNITGLREINNPLIEVSTLFLFMYFSTMAVFYLLYSVMWKKWNGNKIFIFHGISIIIPTIIILGRNSALYLILNLVLFIFLAITVFISSKNKKKHGLHAIYLLLFIFWILNILDILIPQALVKFQILIYLVSIALFLVMLYKVLLKVGN